MGGAHHDGLRERLRIRSVNAVTRSEISPARLS
jgi:hypothetical protein